MALDKTHFLSGKLCHHFVASCPCNLVSPLVQPEPTRCGLTVQSLPVLLLFFMVRRSINSLESTKLVHFIKPSVIFYLFKLDMSVGPVR